MGATGGSDKGGDLGQSSFTLSSNALVAYIDAQRRSILGSSDFGLPNLEEVYEQPSSLKPDDEQ